MINLNGESALGIKYVFICGLVYLKITITASDVLKTVLRVCVCMYVYVCIFILTVKKLDTSSIGHTHGCLIYSSRLVFIVMNSVTVFIVPEKIFIYYTKHIFVRNFAMSTAI